MHHMSDDGRRIVVSRAALMKEAAAGRAERRADRREGDAEREDQAGDQPPVLLDETARGEQDLQRRFRIAGHLRPVGAGVRPRHQERRGISSRRPDRTLARAAHVDPRHPNAGRGPGRGHGQAGRGHAADLLHYFYESMAATHQVDIGTMRAATPAPGEPEITD